MSAPDGRATNALFGFLQHVSSRSIDTFRPDGVIVRL